MVSSEAGKAAHLRRSHPEDDLRLEEGDAASGFYAKYEPKEVLGKGLSSVVRRCVQKHTGEEFAVKIMDVSAAADVVDEDGLNLREQVAREVDVLRRVSGHQNIVTLHDVFESDTFIFLVFELCRNGELFDFLTSKVRLTEKRVRIIMKQVLEAVTYCHQMGVVHRDLKPENILLDDAFNVKLTDFGFAKVLQGGDRLYEVCGTPGYLAPELLKAGMLERDECNGYSFEVDAWACGVIMYTLLVGCPPFWHRRQLTMIRLIMEARYSFPSPDWDAVTDEAKDLISQFLVVEPEKRITAAGALKHPVFKAPRCSLGRQMSLNAALMHKQLLQQQGVADNDDEPVQIMISSEEAAKADMMQEPPFKARHVFRIGLTCVRFLIRLRRLRITPEPLSLQQTRVNPYSMRAFRKVIDGGAFNIYSHWVKKGEGQNRAALFEHFPRREMRNKRNSVQQELESR